MYAVIIIIHVIVSIFLIAVILLQAGRGGGLADSVGSSQMQNLFGTKSTTVLTKLTTICATLFILTCISLAVISSYRSKSLVDKVSIPEVAAQPDLDEFAGEEEEGPALPPGEGPIEQAPAERSGQAVEAVETSEEPVPAEPVEENAEM